MKIRIVKTVPPIKKDNNWFYSTYDTVEVDFDGFAEALCMDAELNIVDCKTAESFIETFINEMLKHGSAHWTRPKKKTSRKKDDFDMVEDGFGSSWSAYCPECGKKAVHVVRPGKAQCGNCG